MTARYAALPNHAPSANTRNELDAAFDDADASDGELESESTPLNTDRSTSGRSRRSDAGVAQTHAQLSTASDSTSAIPGAYDFERDYDYPPPGSPPPASAFARPNDIGNSNGLMPTSPIHTEPAQRLPRRGFFQRAVGAILPTHYARVPVDERLRHVRGGGVENDGVFANVMAKPQRARVITTEDGDVRIAPEETQKEAPPSYADAQADAVPPYWETTVHAPAGFEAGEFMVIDDLPSGSIWIFVLNAFISFFFQFVGFLLTYLLHTSHAAKFGSRAGLGLTLIQYGFYSRATQEQGSGGSDDDVIDPIASIVGRAGTDTPSMFESPSMVQPDSLKYPTVSTKDWLSFLLMTLGWFLLLSSTIGFFRVKRWEKSIRASSAGDPTSPEDVDRDRAIQRNLHSIFGISLPVEEPSGPSQTAQELSIRQDVNGSVIVIPSQELLEEARLARDLRAAGLI